MDSKTKSLSVSAWLKAAREPCLNFLRNLSPQILIASLAWVIASKLDFTKFDSSNSPLTILFYGFLLLFLYAAYANATIFLSKLFPTFEPWLRNHEEQLKSLGKSGFSVPLLMIKAIFSERKTEFILVVVVALLIEFTLAGTFISSIASASAFLKLAHGG